MLLFLRFVLVKSLSYPLPHLLEESRAADGGPLWTGHSGDRLAQPWLLATHFHEGHRSVRKVETLRGHRQTFAAEPPSAKNFTV